LETGATALFLTSPSNRVRCHQQQHREQNNNIFLLAGDLFCLQQRGKYLDGGGGMRRVPERDY
jgi:hypothetical protein